MQDSHTPLGLLTAMFTPAVLISACGTLIFSTSNRLARIVDRVRMLSALIEQVFSGQVQDFQQERKEELDRQLVIYARRSQLVQHSLSGLYVALGAFVATTVSVGVTAFVPFLSWMPTALGIAGTLIFFYSSVLLIAEARMALRSVNQEMEFALRLRKLYEARHGPR